MLTQSLNDPANFSDLTQNLRFYLGLTEADVAELLQFARAVKHEVTPRRTA
jgi:hypothetical protein